MKATRPWMMTMAMTVGMLFAGIAWAGTNAPAPTMYTLDEIYQKQVDTDLKLDTILSAQTLSSTTAVVNAGYYEATTLSAVDENLVSENIRKDVEIFGVNGTYEATGTNAVQDYLVVDLSGGADATNYPVVYYRSANEIPGSLFDDTYKTNRLIMRLIPAGTFMMGSPADELARESNETLREVTLTQAYYMGVFQVTQRQWELVMGNKPSYFNNASYDASRPVEKVSYHDIREDADSNAPISTNWPQSSAVGAGSFVGKLRARTGLSALDLPTEGQWEYACRAGTTMALNRGKNLTASDDCPNMSEVGRYYYNHPGGYSSNPDVSTDGGTAKIGTCLPNAWGLHDMHGNVFEWCLDWYTDESPGVEDPVGAASGSFRVARGGSWNHSASFCRSAYRFSLIPSSRNYICGFRLSGSLP